MKIKNIKTCACALLLAALAAPAAAEFSDDEIRIAVMTGMRGVNGGMGSVVGAELAAEEMGGEVLGRTIRIIPVDHGEKVDQALAEAERLRREENVDAFADIIGSHIAVRIQQYATEHNIAALQTTSATTRLTNDLCSPVAVHWNQDMYALVNGAVRAVLDQGLDTWFIVRDDRELGKGLARVAEETLRQHGGRVVGTAVHKFRSGRLLAQLEQAQASGAKVIALANAGADTVAGIRAAYEIGILGSEQTVVTLVNNLATIRKLDVYATSGLIFNTGFYWNYDARTARWSEQFKRRQGYMPNMHHASTYSGVLHYLKAVQAAGTDEARAVMAKMRELTPEDEVFRNSKVRPDGRMTHDMYLVQVKPPLEVTERDDYLKVLRVIPPERAFRPLEESECPLLAERKGAR